jgi:hypothetical protein
MLLDGTVPPAPHRTRLQDRVPIDAINAEAAQVTPGRVMQALIGAPIFWACWLVAKAFTLAFKGLVWMFTAGKMGWRQARGMPLQQPTIDQVLRENAQLRAQISRFEDRTVR